MKIGHRLRKINPSLTLEITSLTKKMRQQGQAVVNFAAGEPDFDTPNYIKEAAIQSINEGFTKYTPVSGLPELKQQICRKLEKDNSLLYSTQDVVVTCGAKHALYNILQALCEKEDEVIIPSPYWVSYPQMVKLTDAKERIVKTYPENGFKLDKKALASKINRKTKVVILNSPANPTGSVYSRKELEEISKVLIRHNIYIISDEIYEKLTFDGKVHTSIASLNRKIFQRTIVVNGVSKAYAMTGWRIGYLACPDKSLIDAVTKLQSHSTSNPCSISQRAAIRALKSEEKTQMRKTLNEFQLRRDCMLEGLSKSAKLSFFKPEGAFYVFCSISKLGLSSTAFACRLLKEAKVAVIPGVAFGRDDYIRLSFATSRQQIEEGTHRIKVWINGLYNS